MAKQGAKTVVPRLRFPEFRGATGWTIKTLGDEGEFLSSLTGKTAQHFGAGSAKFVTYMNVFINTFTDMASLGVVDVASDESQNAVEVGDVLFTVSSETPEEVGMSSVVLDAVPNCYVNSFCALFRFAQDKRPNLHFVGYSLRHPLARRHFAKRAQGSTRFNLSKPAFRSLPLATPSPAEQQKIADCLTSLDEVITAQARKVEALKAHKRGLMQQLFPRKGETRPRLRFPEFRNAPEWISRPLSELMPIGSSRRVHESDWATSGVPFYRAREIVALSKGESINPLFISEALYAEFVGFTGEIEEGQLLVTGVGSIGIPYLVKDDDRFYFKDGNIIWLKNNQGDLSGNFLLRLFESEYMQDQIVTMAGVGTVGTYTIENAKRTVAVFPVDKCEQKRIADCLSSLNTQITAETAQLAALKTHKQGLMQQLFPVTEDR